MFFQLFAATCDKVAKLENDRLNTSFSGTGSRESTPELSLWSDSDSESGEEDKQNSDVSADAPSSATDKCCSEVTCYDSEDEATDGVSARTLIHDPNEGENTQATVSSFV